MNNTPTPRKFTRRDFLKLGGQGVLLALLAKTAPTAARQLGAAMNARPGSQFARPFAAPLTIPPDVYMRLAATDGFISLPNRAEPLYIFGFVQVPIDVPLSVPPTAPVSPLPDALDVYKGNVQLPAPIIGVDQEAETYITLINLGLVMRPDLDDAHTIHWHGFPNATAIFDGVPEVSIAVPPARNFPYYYKPHVEGTFMYHCHFEDVEHIQMGMTGIVYVRPSQNAGSAIEYPPSSGKFYTKFAYNDTDGRTGYDREFAMLLEEIWTTPHDNLVSIQETIWPDYKANYWLINGRAYPDTVKPMNDPSLPSQPISSLIQVNPGDHVLLRFANLGYEQHSMQLQGIPMRVVGEDAMLLYGPGGLTDDTSYLTNALYIGPGEARDVIFEAPNFDGSASNTDSDDWGTYNFYRLQNRSPHKLTNNGASGLGGMVTEVRVYDPVKPVPDQGLDEINKTYS